MHFPDRNILAGGLAAVIVWLAMSLLSTHGVSIDPATQTAVVAIVGFGLTHFIPPAAQDIVNKLNDGIVQMAQADPHSNVSYVLPPAAVPPGQPAIIGGPPTVGGIATITMPAPDPSATVK